ncbi:MAG: hypothetical protein ACRDOK_03495 [Streptosporangiaceae bacterium]
MITEDFPPQLSEPQPSPARSVVAVGPPGPETGSWTGAPSAVFDGDEIILAYRLRRGPRRGYAVAVARSADGVHFQTMQLITKEEMDAESLERPALVLPPAGGWRLYLSCATPRTKHWRVELLEAPAPDAFDPVKRVMVLPGDAGSAVKDPVIRIHEGTWHLWASVHPLADPDHTDRMTTDYFSSADGVDWAWHGPALTPRPGAWDARGVRVSAVRFAPGQVVAHYDGRAAAAENFEERTGLATGTGPAGLTATDSVPVGGGPDGTRGLRYVDIAATGDGRERWYYELTRPDGLHELRTELRPR